MFEYSRVDFRNVVRYIFSVYGIRIWMSQVEAYPTYNKSAKDAIMTGVAPDYDMGNDWVTY